MPNDIRSLVDSGRLRDGAEIFHPGRSGREVAAHVTREGVVIDGKRYPSLSTAAGHVSGHPTNGWTFWRLRETGRIIAELRAAGPQD